MVELSALVAAEKALMDSRRKSKSGARVAAERDPATMTPNNINKELGALFEKSSELNQAFIDAGRGYEKPSETWQKQDPLALQFRALHDRIRMLQNEVTRHMGPGYSEFPISWTRGKFNKPRAGRF